MKKKARFDFQMEVINTDKASGHIKARLLPDIRRYVEVERDGKRFYLDKYLNVLISMEEMASNMKDLPIFHLSPSIDSTPDYASRRREAVTQELGGGEYISPPEIANRHKEFLAEPGTRDISFLSVDICGSTAYRLKNSKGFDQAYAIFLRELGTVVGQFNGTILKTTGDGFIAYVDHPSFTSQCDATIDMCLSLLVVVRDAVNPALSLSNLPPLIIRVGADYGPAHTRNVNIPSTGFSTVEVSSDALNRAVKIQESSEPGELRIGRELYELVHVQWLERATEVKFDGTTVGINDYKVYRVQ
ncbi:adenylate/guanylate cyclase domain-containing protein [Burkholderia pseudomultivorans]|uniref:adenylate/guanylate cyclase domain-containing protein n=1 Tax=Burkholderia pseudomultivorans TaxID=1207504 RepID=UPI000A6ACF36|nr:adenylate/guanylate cyclase domain-containing protein [Burkholderia pseudomultivorans]